MINQVKSYNEYSKKRLGLFFYGLAGGNEVDLVIETKKRGQNASAEIIAIEFKLGEKWKNEWKKSLSILSETPKIKILKKYIVYTGKKKFETDNILVCGADDFLTNLFNDDVF
jgi:hypothetical protein